VVTRAGCEMARKALPVVEEADAAFFEPVATSVDRLLKMFGKLVEGSG
jgi:hypothetical protein